MAIDLGASTLTAQTGALDSQADLLLKRTRSVTSGAFDSSRDDAKIVKAGKDFESILLGNWLQQAEQSFATVPGGDGQEADDDSGKDQFQGIAMQALAGSLTASGGIGIARMITDSLRSRHGSSRAVVPLTEHPASSSSASAASTTTALNKSS